MKKILFVHQASVIGGGSYCMLNIIKELDQKLFYVEVLLPEYGPLCDELKKLGIKYYFLSGLRGIPYNRNIFIPKYFFSYIKVFVLKKSFRRFLLKHSYDIVYLNSMVLYPFLKVVKTLNIKTVIHIREHWPLSEHRIQLYYAQIQVKEYADKVFAINRYSASMFPQSSSKCCIAYDWVDMSDRFEHCPLDKIFGVDSSKLKVFLYTGGFDRFKGPKEVFTVFSNVVRDNNARLLVMGEKPKETKNDYLKDCLYLLEKDKRIVCIPRTYKIQHIIEQSYCVLSYFTVPHANLGIAENIILRKLTIAADNEEAREYSMDGSLAILYKANDIEDFAKAVDGVDAEYEQKIKAIKNNSDSIRVMFDKERNVKLIIEQLKTL